MEIYSFHLVVSDVYDEKKRCLPFCDVEFGVFSSVRKLKVVKFVFKKWGVQFLVGNRYFR